MAHLDIDFISNTLERAVKITLILPSKTAPTLEREYIPEKSTYYQDKKDRKYPLLILLHGYLNDCSNWFSYARAEMYAEENNIAIVTICGENQFFINLTPFNRFYDFIEYELKDFLYGNFPVSPLPKDNFIAGLSMGGFGALYHASHHPDAYAACGAFSPAIYNDIAGVIKKNDITDSVLQNKDKLPSLYVAVGKEDSLYHQNMKFARFCRTNNINLEFETLKGYAHEWRFWDLELEKFIKWIPRSDDYKGESPRGV